MFINRRLMLEAAGPNRRHADEAAKPPICCVLDSEISIKRNGKHIAVWQRRLLEQLETWPVEVIGSDPIMSLLDGPYSQANIDFYFELIQKIADLGPDTSSEKVAKTLAEDIKKGSWGLFNLSVVCGLFSLELARESVKQLEGPESWRIKDGQGYYEFQQILEDLRELDDALAR